MLKTNIYLIDDAVVRSLVSGISPRLAETDPTFNVKAKVELDRVTVALNVWVALYSDLTDKPASLLVRHIVGNGLQNSIREAAEVSDRIRDYYRSVEPDEETFSQIPDFDYYVIGNQFWYASLKGLPVVDCLTITSYLKRLKLDTLDVETQMWKDFKANNRRLRYWPMPEAYANYSSDIMPKAISPRALIEPPRPMCPSYYLDELVDIFTYIFDGYNRDQDLLVLAPGVTAEGLKSYYDKGKVIFGSHSDWCREHGLDIPWTPAAFWGVSSTSEKPLDYGEYGVVPKNHKTGRGIVKEPTPRQTVAYQVDSGVRKCPHFAENITLTDQSRNQVACLLGSMDPRRYATYDYTAASDSMSVWLISELCRKSQKLWEDLCLSRSSYIKFKDEKIYSNLQSTMGNACTFSLESGVFLTLMIWADIHTAVFYQADKGETVLARGIDARLYYKHFNRIVRDSGMYRQGDRISVKPDDFFANYISVPSRAKTKNWTLKNWIKWSIKHHTVYGDDCCGPAYIKDALQYISNATGFKLNLEKSFFTGCIRESCGVEAINGYLYHLPIYPRGTSSKLVMEWISVQHELADISPTASMYLEDVIRGEIPSITKSSVGSIHSDIWDPFYKRSADESSDYANIVSVGLYTLRPWFKEFLRRKDDLKFRLSLRKFGYDVERVMLEFRWAPVGDHRFYMKSFDTFHDSIITPTEAVLPKVMPSDLKDVVLKDRVYHTTFISKNPKWAKALCEPEGANNLFQQVEFLMYYMHLGGCIEHINNSPFTAQENLIYKREDLFGEKTTKTTKLYYFD